MPDTQVIFQGGPCEGTARNMTAGEIKSLRVQCGGITYLPNPNDPFRVGAANTFEPASVVNQQSVQSAPYGLKDASAAWSRLNRALIRAGSDDIPAINAATARLNRIALPKKRG